MSDKKSWHGGELIARALKNEGVDTIFALSGGHINSIFDGCLTEGVRIIDTRHEEAAVMMAEGYARYTGKPGVVVLTAGPGVVNGIPGIAVASQSGAPVVVIAGRSSLARRDLGSMQDVDQLELVRPLTKWARSAYQTHRLPEYVASAFRHAVTGSPGPVFLEIPIDIVQDTAPDSKVRFPSLYYTGARPFAGQKEVEEAAELLKQAERPVIVAGSGVWWSGASEDLISFAETTGIPVYTRNMGRGTIPEDHPLAGGFFPMGLMQSDLVLILGTRLDWTIGYGRPPLISEQCKVIQVDIRAEDIGQNRPVNVGIPGDIKAVLQQLTTALKDASMQVDASWPDMIRGMKAAALESVADGMNSDDEPIHPARMCREVAEYLPRNASVVADGGDIAGFTVLILKALQPASLIWNGAFGHLGVGLPYAIGGKIAQPDRPIVIISGDGSFGLSAMEYDTAIRHNIPVVTVISNDSGWGQIRRVQRQNYGPDRVVGCELAGCQRYDRMVESLGGFGVFVEKLADLRPALEEAFASGKPACVNVHTDPNALFTGMNLPWKIH